MRCYNIASGILLIFSIIDFALAAPVSAKEKLQPGVDVVHIPKDVISVLGKRGEEDLAKLAEEFSKTWRRPMDSSDAHASSSSAPPGPDPASSSSALPGPDPASSSSELPGPDPASSSSELPGPDPASSSSELPGHDYASWDSEPAWSQQTEKDSIVSGPLYTPESGSPPEGSPVHSLAGEYGLPPNPYTPSPNADPGFDWEGWMKKVNSPESEPWTEGIGLDPASEHQVGHVEPNLASPTGADDGFDWEGWMKKVNSPESEPWTEGTSLGPEHEDNPPAPSPISLTEPDSDRNLMAAHQLPPYPLSPTGFDMDPHFSLPPIKTDRDPYANPPSSPTSPTDLYMYSYPGTVAHPPPSGADLPTVPDHEVVPPTPSTYPEINLDHPSSSAADLPAADLPATDSQFEDDQAAMRYALKGKAKVLD